MHPAKATTAVFTITDKIVEWHTVLMVVRNEQVYQLPVIPQPANELQELVVVGHPRGHGLRSEPDKLCVHLGWIYIVTIYLLEKGT